MGGPAGQRSPRGLLVSAALRFSLNRLGDIEYFLAAALWPLAVTLSQFLALLLWDRGRRK